MKDNLKRFSDSRSYSQLIFFRDRWLAMIRDYEQMGNVKNKGKDIESWDTYDYQ